MISTRQITYALAVAKMRHFKKAAEYCSVSQSALSSAITELEKQLGIQIFERDNKQVLITNFGREFLQRAQKIKIELNDLEELAQRAKNPLSSSMKIAVIPTIGPYLLPKVLPAVHQHYPNLRLTLVEAQSHELVEQVKSGIVDTGILALPYPVDHLHAFEFLQENFYVVMHVDNPLAQCKAIHTSQLEGASLMLLEDGHCLKDHALAVCQLTSNMPNDLAGTSLYTLVQMVAGKMGVTLLPAMAVEQLVDNNAQLVALPLTEPGPHRRIAFVTRLNYTGVVNVEALITLFKAELAHKAL